MELYEKRDGKWAMNVNIIGNVNEGETVPVEVTNFPATQPVSGQVAVSNFPSTQPVSGAVEVTNLPATQPVSGTVSLTAAQYNALAKSADIAKLTSGSSAATVTPADGADLAGGATKGLYVGTTGDVVVDMAAGATVTLKDLAAGIIHPISVRRVRATDTTAADILAIY